MNLIKHDFMCFTHNFIRLAQYSCSNLVTYSVTDDNTSTLLTFLISESLSSRHFKSAIRDSSFYFIFRNY
jgi:hypothetical protein